MSKIARGIIVQTTNHVPLALVGVGLIATVAWVSAVAGFTVWSALQAAGLV